MMDIHCPTHDHLAAAALNPTMEYITAPHTPAHRPPTGSTLPWTLDTGLVGGLHAVTPSSGPSTTTKQSLLRPELASLLHQVNLIQNTGISMLAHHTTHPCSGRHSSTRHWLRACLPLFYTIATDGTHRTAREVIYIVHGVSTVFLSFPACMTLDIVLDSFPIPGPGPVAASMLTHPPPATPTREP